MNKFHKIRHLILLLFAILCFSACQTESHKPLRIGTNYWVGYEPLYLARERGFFSETNINLTELPSASDVIRAFRNELIDCAALTLDECYLLMQDGYDIKILLIIDISEGSDAILANPSIETLADIKDKRIGVENSAVGAYVLSRALEKVNLDPKDINIITRIASGHAQAYLKGEVDAVVCFEPTKSHLLERGAKVIFDSQQIPNEIYDLLVVNTSIYEKRKKEFNQLQKIWFEALTYTKENPNDAANLAGKRLKLTQEQYIKALNGIKQPNANESQRILQEDFLESAQRVKDFMLKKKLLKQHVSPEKLLLAP